MQFGSWGRRPYLADILENSYGPCEVSYVEDWKLQVNVSIVTDAVCQRLTTRFTCGIFLTNTLK